MTIERVAVRCEWCAELPAAHQIGQDGIPMWLICHECLEILKHAGGLSDDQ